MPITLYKTNIVEYFFLLSSMHCSLCIPEIVSLIFYETLDGAEQSLNHLNRDSAQTLAGLARTCKAFRDPALDLLWKSQYTVMNVLNCMPGDIWEVLDDTDAEEAVSTARRSAKVLVNVLFFYFSG